VATIDRTAGDRAPGERAAIDQRIGTTSLVDGTPIAYARTGTGPSLVYVSGWLTHLDVSWAIPAERGLYETLARGRTLIRYDKPGCGLSGSRTGGYTMDVELETLGAVIDAAVEGPYELVGASLGAPVAAAWAAEHGSDVSRLVLYGGWARGRDIADPAVQRHVLGLVEGHWGLGSDVLADIFAPSADAPTRAAFVRYQREAAPPETVRAMLALAYEIDVTDALGRIGVPTLVLHRDRDRAAPLAHGQALAAAIPGATLEVLPGRDHLPYIGDADAYAASIRRFLGLPAARRSALPTLTTRQREVAALVAEGLTNRAIAERLHITERSAESHVERIRDRLGFRSRAQIAAWFVASA
jgi:pimeloyl-ACP methyl ester carboxylesterase/DNA-binding CsgD family transcriptional regulator